MLPLICKVSLGLHALKLDGLICSCKLSGFVSTTPSVIGAVWVIYAQRS